MAMVHAWISDNIDKLFEEFKHTKFVKSKDNDNKEIATQRIREFDEAVATSNGDLKKSKAKVLVF